MSRAKRHQHTSYGRKERRQAEKKLPGQVQGEVLLLVTGCQDREEEHEGGDREAESRQGRDGEGVEGGVRFQGWSPLVLFDSAGDGG